MSQIRGLLAMELGTLMSFRRRIGNTLVALLIALVLVMFLTGRHDVYIFEAGAFAFAAMTFYYLFFLDPALEAICRRLLNDNDATAARPVD